MIKMPRRIHIEKLVDLGVLGIDAIKPGICKEACVASGFERKLEKTSFKMKVSAKENLWM